MKRSIVVTSALREKFQTAWKQRQIVLFSAPCGFGKNAYASSLLEPYTVCRLDAKNARLPELSKRRDCDTVLIDNLHLLKDSDLQKTLCEMIQKRPEMHFVFLSRGPTPGWLMPFRYEPRMQVFEYKDLMLDQKAAEQLFQLFGVLVTPAEMSAIMDETRGYPLALKILCCQMQDGRQYSEEVDADVRRELFTYFQTAVYCQMKPASRRLLLDLAPFEPFDVEFARILSGNRYAGKLLGEMQQDSTMFLYDDLCYCRFWPVFRQFLLWQQEREYSQEEQERLYERAALYYELHDDYKNALFCYTRCGKYEKVSDLLIKNSELHPGLAHYEEMEEYYRSLPNDQIMASPVLMAGMSMLCAVCMEYEESEEWYRKLKSFAEGMKRSDEAYKAVRGRLVYLDIALPQRNVDGILDTIPFVAKLLTNRTIVMPEFSVTSRLPSIMNGGKDFCEWSKKDDELYQRFRLPLKILLKRDGIGLPECAIAESKFEKGEEITGRLLDLMSRQEQIQQKGTPDIEFAIIGLLVRLRLDQGEADHAREHLESLRSRFQRPDCLRFYPNIDAMMCRVAMYQGDEETVDRWYREMAPKDLMKLRVMQRYRYLTHVMVEISYGNYQEALLIMARLRPYFTVCRRTMDLICLDLLTAICYFRSRDGDWQTPFCRALDACFTYRFIRPVSQYGAAVLPLLEKAGWSADAAFLERLTAAVRKQAAQYPDFLRCQGELAEPLFPAEMKVLRLLCHHKSNAEIGAILGIKLPTVKTYVSSILRKLGVKNRGAVKDAAQRLHLI